jgi:hypothetical protein
MNTNLLIAIGENYCLGIGGGAKNCEIIDIPLHYHAFWIYSPKYGKREIKGSEVD